MQYVSGKLIITALIVCLTAGSFAHADSYNSNWNFSLGCPTHDDTSGSGSISVSSGGFSGGGSCSRLSNGFGKYNFTSSNGGSLRSSNIYPLQMGNLSFVPPVRTTDTTPVFSVAAHCPTATKDVNWIFIQSAASRTSDYFWGRSTMTPTSTTMTKFYDIDGNQLFNGNYTLPVGSCASGVIDVSGSSDFQAKIYSANDWSGFYKTGPGNVSFFAAPLQIDQSYLLNKTYVGLLYSSQDGDSSRYVQVVADPSDPIFLITSYTDPETNTFDFTFSDTITITDFNSPLSGMMRGTVQRRDGSFNIVGTTEKIGCLVYETGTGGIVISCAGKNPADNTTQYSVTFNYKFPSGTLDTSFNSTGEVSWGAGESANGMMLQADGKIVTAMSRGIDFSVARFNTDGALDTSFNGTGYHDVTFDHCCGKAIAAAVQPDGKIIAVGDATGTAAGITAPRQFAIARFNTDGTLDASFGGDGKVMTSFGNVSMILDSDTAWAVAIQGDGKIVVAGDSFRNSVGSRFAIARYYPNGDLDTSFSDDGLLLGQTEGAATSLLLLPDDKIIVGGTNGSDAFVLAKYNSDGSLDTNFDDDGIASVNLSETYLAISQLALQSDDKILMVGTSGPEVRGTILRFDPDGSLDTSFDGDGIVLGADETIYNGIAVQSDGKIVVGGGFYDVQIARYNSTGNLDSSFDGDGVVDVPSDHGSYSAGIALQSDGKILSGGLNWVDSGQSAPALQLIRLWP